MNVKDRRPMESTAGDAGPIGRREAAECDQHEDAGHPQIEMARAGAQDRVAGHRRLQCATCFRVALSTVWYRLLHWPRIRTHRHARMHFKLHFRADCLEKSPGTDTRYG